MNEALGAWFESMKAGLVAAAPTVFMAIGLSSVGLIVAFVMRRVSAWAVRRTGLEALGETAGVSRLLYAVGIREGGVARLVGQVVFYSVLLLTLSAVAEVLGLSGVATLISALMQYLPRLLTALLVLVAGVWIAGFLQKLVVGFG
ncbi:MAG: hypothetical protein KC492_25285, partial [Myxococcales bacterium]|nr:hypothetical protein [Myxococcales bacterium]